MSTNNSTAFASGRPEVGSRDEREDPFRSGGLPLIIVSSSRGESSAHRALKLAACQWARDQGYRAVGMEIRIPSSPYRADAAACRLDRPRPGEPEIGACAVFECKQSRADFLKDAAAEQEGWIRLEQLKQRRNRLEDLLLGHYPDLRQGGTLFPEFDVDRSSSIRHLGYQKTVRDLLRLENALSGRTKFHRLIRYAPVNLLYLVTWPGVVRRDSELPSGWGHLEAEIAPDEGSPPLRLVRSPVWIDTQPARRLELLYRIASSAMRSQLSPGSARPANNGETQDG